MEIEEKKSKLRHANSKNRQEIRKALEAVHSPGVEKVIPDGEDLEVSDDLSDKEEPIGEEVNAKRSFKEKRG